MKDDPVHYISDYGLLKPPTVWSKRRYWTVQIIQLAACPPILAWLLTSFPVPLWPTITILTIGFMSTVMNFHHGREEAERYTREQGAGAPLVRP